METIKKAIWAVVITISLLVISWFVISYIEVISKNNHANPKYSEYNAFVMLVQHKNN